ncbi:hypothetical protein LX15_003287 [Streptoalloteichus tenebrarius]|uniref:DUF2332 domain-containing protein n=1 Tax=Streptoalloteichus tenebrarius (strain ATCC 17920 / DSM 40477 / JCM 4838 / CBS 697.72 / NBRC 16177 / NCIMB 11028 / NRRL B-12390 / A12253. 1 / ISP 5477) TaxID=1933 RepID=A0ABT1HVU1_STRSD|nr:DUF2332 domain-containing protein [Streptoalloteichus tenebrarius]MCP2259582.1 hypothetical protein [Streptoalloteichus tenebrarius]BFF01011.1 DUF2332 domain-containing protein [Streptoalloteichus tenebrarius]
MLTALSELPALFRSQARTCLPGSPLTHALLSAAADDLDAGGVTAEVMAGAERDRGGTVPGLRFAGAVHRLVLEGRAPELARHYPNVGGRPRLDELWGDVEPVLREHVDELRRRVRATVVQTNEPGRMAPMLGGLLVAAERAAREVGRDEPFPVRLLEIGASGGLNLRPDRVAVPLANGDVLGDPDSPLRLDPCWTGLPPADLSRPARVVERAGCDTHPVDVTTEDGRLHLSSFVWPDQLDRWARLREAIRLAVAEPVAVEPMTGPDWLGRRLAQRRPGVLTVVWHSVVWQYVRPGDRARGRSALAEAAAHATPDAPLALLVYEPRRVPASEGGPYRFDLLLRLWPAGLSLHLGSGGGHGIPFTWNERTWD